MALKRLFIKRTAIFLSGIILPPLLWLGTGLALAQPAEVERLQDQIAERTNRLAEIQAEIAEYEKALTEVGAERETLQAAINQLELERKKVEADIRYTEEQINATDLTINKLSYEIQDTEASISRSQEAIKQMVRRVNAADEESFIEIFLRHGNLADFWTEFETLEMVRANMSDQVRDLLGLKQALESNRELTAKEREQLLSLKNQYSDQQNILVSNRQDKAELLSATKNEEAEYQRLLSEKQAARDKLMAEVREIESQIQFILDPNTIPAKGTAVFIWPINNPVITQYFGYTQFARSGAYGGSQHNGIDIGAPTGTKIHAPLTGTIRNIGDTDAVPGCYSWGKWVLIDHPNGLSSMFAHLSQIAVQPGQKVQTGDVVGYVGSTGYSTGPHLHYTLYVKEGVQVMQFNQFKTVTGCGAALSPFAGIEAYLDPLDYLPAI